MPRLARLSTVLRPKPRLPPVMSAIFLDEVYIFYAPVAEDWVCGLVRAGDPVQLVQGLRRKRKLRSGQIFTQVRNARGSGDEQNVRRALQQPGERDLHRCGFQSSGDIRQCGGLQRCESPEREERYVGDTLPSQGLDQRIVGPMRQIVVVLHADDLADS